MFYVNDCGVVCKTTPEDDESINWKIGLGNLFKTEAEAGLAAQKLYAWKRIKDAGLLNSNWHYEGGKLVVVMEFAFNVPILDGDLDMVFKK